MREFPKVFMRFEGRKVVDGKRRQYWIQDATEDLYDDIIYNLVTHFVGDEPTTKYMNCPEDKVSIEDFRLLWRKMLDDKLTLVCLTKDEQNNTKLAGFNMLLESKADDNKEYHMNGECSKKLFRIFDYVEAQRDFHKEFNLKTCMKAMGLYVLSDYRGEGLGERILDARELLCRSIGLPGTITAFTSVISQKLAARVGFKDFYSIDFEELARIDPGMAIPNIQNHTKTMKFMYKLYK